MALRQGPRKQAENRHQTIAIPPGMHLIWFSKTTLRFSRQVLACHRIRCLPALSTGVAIIGIEFRADKNVANMYLGVA